MGNLPRDVIKGLGPGEEVQLFIKTKIYHPRINVDSVVLTNERIILRETNRLLGRRHSPAYLYTDHLWAPYVENAVTRPARDRSSAIHAGQNSSNHRPPIFYR